MKYGIWKCAQPEAQDVNALVSGGFPPLAAMVLAGRGLKDAKKAQDFLCCSGALPDPFAMTDMEKLFADFTLTERVEGRCVLTGCAPVETMRDYQKEVYAYTFEGECYDIGTPESYREVCELYDK